MPSRLPPPPTNEPDRGIFKCGGDCILCTKHLQETKHFQSSQTKETFTIRKRYSCTSTNIIYLLFCNVCPTAQYVGETKNTLKKRFYKHRSDIMCNSKIRVHKHFNQRGHTVDNMRCLVIEEVRGKTHDARKRREDFWMAKLKTVCPFGLNSFYNFKYS